MENRKYALVLIILLLIIFVPLTIVGFIVNFNKQPVEENPNHELYYEGSLWFYDNNDKLLNKYECKTEKCDLANVMIDDDEYGINYYKDGNLDKIEYSGSSHTFITDGDNTSLYDIVGNRTLLEIEGVKTYNTKLSNNLYIIKSKNKWGVVRIDNKGINDFRTIIPIEYDFIGLKNNELTEDTLNADIFIVKQNAEWYLMNSSKVFITNSISTPIINYSNNYLVSKDADNYIIYKYDGERYYNNYIITNYALSGEYIAIVTNNVLAIFKDTTLLNTYPLTDVNAKIELVNDESNLTIKVDENIVGTIAIN